MQASQVHDQGGVHQPRAAGRQLPADAVLQEARRRQQQPAGRAGAAESARQNGL